MRPDDSVVQSLTGDLKHEALSQPGQAYALYVYAPSTAPFSKKQIAPTGEMQTELTLQLHAGNYSAEWIDTKSGQGVAQASLDHAGGNTTLKSPIFVSDIALRILRR